MKPICTINARAPVRINDLGGWTDTWFAERGKVLNMAVQPGVEVQVKVYENEGNNPERVVFHQENYSEKFSVNPEKITGAFNPMLEAALALIKIPHHFFLDINVYSGVPAASSTGTSASVSVSLLGALSHLTGKKMMPYEIAYLAHRLETEMLNLQSGIQDQLCAALGGINYIDMYQYPHTHVTPIMLPDYIELELENRLLLFYLGPGHISSELHKKVIENLEDIGPDNPLLARLRRGVDQGKDSLVQGDFKTFGRVMSENTEIQRELHPDLVSKNADILIGIAREFSALGWKVNGAGGEGGSLTVLTGPDRPKKREMIREVERQLPRIRHAPISASTGR